MDSGWDVHFMKNRCWISKDDGNELDMIRSGGVFFVAARPSKLSSKEANTLELNPMTAAEVEQAALAREHAAFGTPGPSAAATLEGDGEPTVRIRVPTGPATPSAEERALHEASGHVPYRSRCQWCIAARAADKPHLREQQPDTDEAVPRIEFDFADLGREEDQELPTPYLNAVDVGSESLSATLCPTKAFSEYLVETILAFVEALGHNVVMLHSEKEPVLEQLWKAVQSRRVKRTLVKHGPRASHQSQSKIENAKRMINGVCRAMWLSLENLLQEKTAKRQHTDSVADSTRSVEPDDISSEKRRENCICACFWESVHEPSVAIRRKERCTSARPCQQAIWNRDGAMESGLERCQ